MGAKGGKWFPCSFGSVSFFGGGQAKQERIWEPGGGERSGEKHRGAVRGGLGWPETAAEGREEAPRLAGSAVSEHSKLQQQVRRNRPGQDFGLVI